MGAPTHHKLVATSYLLTFSFFSIKVDLGFRFSTSQAFRMDGFYLGHREVASSFHKIFNILFCVLKYGVIITDSK